MSKIVRMFRRKHPFVIAEYIDPICGAHVIQVDWSAA
jgi:hypothetical protein